MIAGGAGKDTEGVGLYIKADGMIISDASDFVSNGVNYLEADLGFQFGARQHTYVSSVWESRRWYGKKETHWETATTTKGSVVSSTTGQNLLVTQHGGVNAVAARFIAAGGTQILARDKITLSSLKTEEHLKHTKSSWWGLSHKTVEETHQDATPTLFLDNGLTQLCSSEDSIDARGAYFIGNGDLIMKAKKRIEFGCDILDHQITERSRILGASVPGMGAYNQWQNDGTVWQMLTAEDATLAKMDALLGSANKTELAASASNLGINLYNTTNSLMRGLANADLTGEALARYGLDGEQGFSPTINLSLTEQKTTSRVQTQGAGGIDRGGNVSLEAGEGITLENGVKIHAGGNIDINAPKLIATAAALHSSTEQTTVTESLGITPSGQLMNAGVSYSHSSTSTTQYANAAIIADKNLSLHHQDQAMDTVILDGANLKAQTLDGDVKKLVIVDKQTQSSTDTFSASINTSGQISGYKGNGSSQKTTTASGIAVEAGINVDGHQFHVTEAEMTGGKIITDGINNIAIDHLTTHTQQDYEYFSGIGGSVNINDIGRLVDGQPSNQTGEQAIAVGQINIDQRDYQANQVPVIYGAGGTTAQIGSLDGELHTASADGCQVIKDEEVHAAVDVPLTNTQYLAVSQANIAAGTQRLIDILHHETQPPLKVPSLIKRPGGAKKRKRRKKRN